MIDLEGMNPPQREAVLHTEGPLVVFAGAGSGKTRVITHRVAHLVVDHQVYPSRILAVTFTNKAAGEMRQRLEQLVPGGVGGMWVGTFHALCARLLRRHADAVGIAKDFTIYDDQDQQAMIKRVLKDLGLDPKEHKPKSLANRINREKQELRGPEAARSNTLQDRILTDVYEAYEAALRRASALDFGDLIYQTVRALEREPELRREVAGKFRYTMVDEFQDTNHAQLRLVDALVSVHGNVCVVGDDDQGIYRWRGADRRNILDFNRRYPTARVIKLEQNYRSTQRILRAAHDVISRNEDREPKELFTENEEGSLVRLYTCSDANDEANTLTYDLLARMRDDDVDLEDMAVLYRTHAQSRSLEEALRAVNLPYRIIGGVRFYDRAEVKDLLAYLRMVHNPEDDVSVLRVLNVPARGIGKTSEERIMALSAEHGEGVYAALQRIAMDPALLGRAAAKRVGEFVALVEGLRKSHRDGAPLYDLASQTLDKSGYLESLREQDSAEAEARVENLGELMTSVAAFQREAEEATLAAFLERVALETQADEHGHEAKLTLMTVHAAKGLEFPVVYVTGLEEGLFPRLDPTFGVDQEELEEERRLAYVAFTRAEEQLVLLHASARMTFGRTEVAMPSRFLADIAADDVQRSFGLAGHGGFASAGGGFGAGGGYGAGGGHGAAGRYAGGGGYGARGGAGRQGAWEEVAPRGAGRQGSGRSGAWDDGRQASFGFRRSAGGGVGGAARGDDDDPYASFRAARSAQSAESGQSYLDTSDVDLDPSEALRPGAKVFHPRFGVGRVRAVEGSHDPAVTVYFEASGATKKLKASFLRPA
ncbi:MAG: UvrD-helicase domain-containing protein [Polyangiales bacterium]